MILHRYFARRFLRAFLGLAVVLFFFIALIDVVDVLRDFTELDVSFGQIVGLVLLKSPGTLNQILPLITLLATITLFITLARSSELVVTRAAGRSAIRSLVAPVVVALIVGAIAVTTLGPIVAAFSNRFASLSENYRTGGNAVGFRRGALAASGRRGGTDGYPRHTVECRCLRPLRRDLPKLRPPGRSGAADRGRKCGAGGR